jgi:hypothetical protein
MAKLERIIVWLFALQYGCSAKAGRWAFAARRPLVSLIALALSISMAPLPAHAAFETGDLQPILTAGRIPGNGNSKEVDIHELRLGLGHYFRDHLGFYGELSLYRPTGHRDRRQVDTIGLGLAFALRWHFLRHPDFSMYADWGLGLMAARDRFPPAGTRHNGTPHFGLGLSARLRRNAQLLVGLRQLHMSNGKGLVPENPSFDGLGGYIGIALKPGFKPPLPPERETLPFAGKGLRIHIDATFKHIDDDNSAGGAFTLGLPLLPTAQLHAQFTFSAAELVGETLWELMLHAYRQTATGRLVLGYSHQGFSVFRSDYYTLQIEHILNDVGRLECAVGLERKNLADDRIFGGLFITVHSTETLALRSGVGFERREYEFFDSLENLNDAGFNFGVEWSPDRMADLGLSVYLTGGIGYDEKTVGLRFQPGQGRTLRERHRRGGFVPLR